MHGFAEENKYLSCLNAYQSKFIFSVGVLVSWEMLRIFLFISILVASAMCINVTICDCASVANLEIFKFSDECNVIVPPKPIQYNYIVKTILPETIHFPAFICSKWIKQLIVKTSFIFSVSEKQNTIAVDLSEEECRNLVLKKRCGDKEMSDTIKTGEEGNHSWEHLEDPIGPGNWWLGSVVYEATNCIVKQTILKKMCNEEHCTLVTPYGKVNTSSGFYSHNHNTIVWEKSWTSINKARIRVVEEGIGDLVQNKVNNQTI